MTALWEGRSVVGAAVGLLRPGSNRAYCGEDICVPVARIPEMPARDPGDLSARHRIPIATYGHIGGGDLHPGHLIDARDPDEVRRVLQVADEIHELALRWAAPRPASTASAPPARRSCAANTVPPSTRCARSSARSTRRAS